MKIVLLENVEHLGIVGDRKEVTNGYARNFLIPKKLAVKQGDPAGKKLVKEIAKKRESALKEISELEKTAKGLEGKRITIKAKAGEQGKLFGAINSAQIVEYINKACPERSRRVNKKKIVMAPIKVVGQHQVKVSFGHKINANVIIEVIEEKTSDKKEGKTVSKIKFSEK